MKLGLMGNTMQPIRRGEMVTGFAVASNDLMRAYMQYAPAEEIVCLYEPAQYQEDAIKESMQRFRHRKIRMVSEYDLLFHGPETLPQIDVLHSVKEDAIPLLSLRESINKPIPLSFMLHGIAEQHLLSDFFYPMLLLPFQPFDVMISTSTAVTKTLYNIMGRLEQLTPAHLRQLRIEQVSLGVDTKLYAPKNRSECRRQLGLPEQAFIILWFGRFSDVFKADLYPLIHVFSQLVNSNPQKKLVLILAGSEDTDYSDQLRQIISQKGIQDCTKIIFDHDVPDHTALYNAADVFTSPIDNIQETFGLTPVEAMACGIPQVVSDWDGYRDTVVDGETGFLIQTAWMNCLNDIALADYLPLNVSHRRMLLRYLSVRSTVVDCRAYFRAFQFLIDHPDERERMSKASRQRACEQFDLRHTVAATSHIWETSLSIAKKTQYINRKRDIPALDIINDFCAYPSTVLERNTRFVLTQHGKNTDTNLMMINSLFRSRFEEADVTYEILQRMRIQEGQSALDFCRLLPQYTASQIMRSLMHLYKYDIIEPCAKYEVK